MMARRFFVAVWMAALVAPAAAFAAESRAALTAPQMASIDAFVKAEMRREHIPGLSVGVYSRGKILLAKGYGLANVELSVPVKPQTIFESGSVGKQFVSAAIMMLVEDGKASLDDSVTKYFADAPAAWKPIRIKNLLSHTSGLAEYLTPKLVAPGAPFDSRLDYTEDDLVKKIEALPLENPPGGTWEYSNTNYVLLGILIHRVTGMTWANYLDKRIFKPLGMSSTRSISEADIILNRAAGYELDGTGLKNQEWQSPTFNSTADGSLYFNVLDLAKWDAALYTTRLLRQSSLDRVWTVFPLSDGKPNAHGYGFGWVIGNQNGHKRIEHGGTSQGFTCHIARYPDDALTVVVLTNLGDARPDVFAEVIAGLADGPLLPPKIAAIRDTQPAIAASLRALLDRIAAGRDIRGRVGPELSALATPAGVRSVRQQLSPLWPGGTLTLVRRTPHPGDPARTLSTFRLSKGGQAVLIVYTRTSEGLAGGFQIQPNREYQL